jgi:hypothetical protein
VSRTASGHLVESLEKVEGKRLHGVVGDSLVGVEKPHELKGAVEIALKHKGPVLVDVLSARQELAMPPKTTLNRAHHFGMRMMKAVLDGRATQLIDLAKVNRSRRDL